MPNKEVFNVNAIDLEQLAICYGLSIAPSVKHLAAAEQHQKTHDGEETDPAMCGGAVGSGLQKKKNMSKLARLKVKLGAGVAASCSLFSLIRI